MISLKTDEEIAKLREGGKILSAIMRELAAMVEPGVDTRDLDMFAEKRMLAAGGKPSFKGYKTAGDVRPFPSTVCTSINHEVVHAPAEPARKLQEGDIIKLDAGLWYEGLCTDMAVSVAVGDIDKEIRRLMEVTKESLYAGVKKAIAGGWISDIGKAVDKVARRNGFSTVKDLVGHGVGHAVHEDPRIPNFLDGSLEPVRIEKGMVLAIEPMINAGSDAIVLMPDSWTIITADGKPSAHFEVTLAITGDGTEVLSPLPDNV
ncbi:MAG: type I methionyl aminopeptidase [Patescibacteria group bacterium]|nr:type I methionyl aminopeptidase [Patescibacteria group bacterium]